MKATHSGSAVLLYMTESEAVRLAAALDRAITHYRSHPIEDDYPGMKNLGRPTDNAVALCEEVQRLSTSVTPKVTRRLHEGCTKIILQPAKHAATQAHIGAHTMQDPTAQEMRNFLHAKYSRDEYSSFEIEEAIYFFAADYHHGQGSNLYSVHCTSPFNPGNYRACSSDVAHGMYLDLIDNFVG